MTNTAIMLANALLKHHRAVCMPHEFRPPITDRCLISYGNLCREAGTPGLESVIGKFLQEVAIWCAENCYPPLNSLAVSTETGTPAVSYDFAPGCSRATWTVEVEDCITCGRYPQTAQ